MWGVGLELELLVRTHDFLYREKYIHNMHKSMSIHVYTHTYIPWHCPLGKFGRSDTPIAMSTHSPISWFLNGILH